jgi:hypothetical protein
MTFLVNLFIGLSTLFCVGLNDPGKNPGTYQDYVLNQLNPDCFYNWAIYSESNLKNPKFDPMLWGVTDGNLAQAVRLATLYKGRTWLVYNEPEGSDQANTPAESAAIWFDKVYESIKAVDSTSTIACCGVMVRTEGIKWLDSFIKTAKHKPDVWHIHIYVNSTNFNDWLSFWNYWLSWNTAKGNSLPTFITETCNTYQEAQDDLLLNLLNYQHPLLKRIYWFSAYPEPQVQDWKCNLLNSDGGTVSVGDIFKDRNSLMATATPHNKITPQPEPPTPTATQTPVPTPTKIPTQTPTPVPTVDETTFIPNGVEPIILTEQIYLPRVSK